MVNPNLRRRKDTEKGLELNENTKKLFQIIYSENKRKQEKLDDSVPRIRVSELVSRLSFVYEKVRNAVDYDEEHLLRKNAISRILRRQVIIEGVIKEVDSQNLSYHLLTELIRGGYLPNNEIPERKIYEVGNLLDKYLILKDQVSSKINTDLNVKVKGADAKHLVKKKNDVIRFILSLAACEIEEYLAPDRVRKMIVSSMFDVLRKNIVLPDDSPWTKDLEIQIYLSIGRKFLKLDEDMLSFVLFKFYNGNWLDLNQVKDPERRAKEVTKVLTKFDLINEKIDEQLNHPLVRPMDKIVRSYALYYNTLADTIAEDPVKIHQIAQKSEQAFFGQVTKTINNKYTSSKTKLWRASLRSIIYIFLTKSVFVVLIEVPAIKIFGEELNILSLIINIAFPAVLLFLIVLTTAKPGKDNTKKILAGVKEVISEDDDAREPNFIRPKKKRGFVTNVIFNAIYTVAFLISIYFIVKILNFIGFTWVSMVIFLFFLAFVSFFSVRVSRGINDLMIVERKENIITLLVDLFYMPIILVGRWLSSSMSRVNIFVFVFDFIVEAPFKVLVDVAEDWTKYVRERRDNVD